MEKESVWDYPRPPRWENFTQEIRVVAGGQLVACSHRALRLLETSHPPSYYIPPEDIRMEWMRTNSKRTFCEFKGTAGYWDLDLPNEPGRSAVAWSYAEPTREYSALKGYLAFYPSRVDECWVDGERVQAQAGDFYGGWLTANLVGPFKGGPGTSGW